MNKVILSGNLVKDCELRTTDGGTNVVSNSVAVKRDFKNANGEYDVDFINFVAWGSQADFINQYAHKGDKLLITGRWQVRNYQAQDGSNRTVNEVIIESVEILSKPQTEQKEDKPKKTVVNGVEINEDDLPF